MKCVRMELGEPDASGRRRPVEIPGSEFTLELDTVIMALGTSPNPLISSTTEGLETNKRKCIVASEENGQTSKAAVLQAEMPLPAQRPLFWRWAPEKRVQKELTNICPANKEGVSYALVSKL